MLLCFYQHYFDFFFFINFILFYILSDLFIYTFICYNLSILNNILYITDFNKNIFMNSNNGFNLLFFYFIFNILSLPPFLMFYIKFLLLKKLTNFFIMLFLFFMLVLSCLTVYYSISLLKIFFMAIYQIRISLSSRLVVFEVVSNSLNYLIKFYYYNRFLFSMSFSILLLINSILMVYCFDLIFLVIF